MKKQFFLALMMSSMYACAQQAVTNSGALQIHAGTNISFFGDLTNTASAALVNNGNVYVKKSLINHQASMNAGAGILYLNGNTIQTISGSEPVKTYHLTTNNSNGFTINNNLYIGGIHTFSSGIITTSASNFVVYEAGSSHNGASDSKHINGWVKKTGTMDFTFPTGTGSYLRTIDLINLSANSEFNVKHSGVVTDAVNVQSPIVSMNSSEHWTINKISGGTAQVRLNWDDGKTSFPNYIVSDLRTVLYSGGAWNNQGGTATGTVTATGSITSNPLSVFGRVGIGSISFVIPVRFITVSAGRENSYVKVNWQTGSEMNVNFYEIQRSVDGISFLTVGTAIAKNLERQSYEFADHTAPSVKLYYRIKATDNDNSTRLSGIVQVKAIHKEGTIELITNPAKNSILLASYQAPVAIYSYQLVNTAGQVCTKGIFNCQGTSTINIPLPSLPAGEYNLIIRKPGEQKLFKIIVQ